MISIEECRKHLGEGLSDQQIVEIRDSLYGLAGMLLDEYIEEKIEVI